MMLTISVIKEWRQFESAEDVWMFGFFAFNTISLHRLIFEYDGL